MPGFGWLRQRQQSEDPRIIREERGMARKSRTPARRVAPPAPASAEFFTPEHLKRRRQAMAKYREAWEGVDDLDPTAPAGHSYGVRKSAWLTANYRSIHRKQAMNIGPQEVIEVLVAAGVKNWVLMGLHGYVGYLAQPRATQDVNVTIPYRERKRAVKAIRQAWPELIVRELSQVVRFLDPADLGPDGKPKAVIDLMQPWGKFQETILKQHVSVDEETQHRIPTLEAALVAKYAAMVSPHRDREKREYDAGDFRRMVRANHDHIRRDQLRRLADEVWDGAGAEIERFIETALSNEPFPI